MRGSRTLNAMNGTQLQTESDNRSTAPLVGDPPVPDAPLGGFSRRSFLGGAITTSLIAVAVRRRPQLVDETAEDIQLTAVRPDTAVIVEPASPRLSLSVERDTDLFLGDFSFFGFTVDKNSTPTSLVATAVQTDENWIGVVVQLPPQAIGEGDYDSPSTSSIPFDPNPVLSQVAGPSRLAFTFTTGDTIPLPTMTVADLLDWSGWNLNVPPTAEFGSGYESAIEPTDIQTSIECPLALILAPVVDDESRIIIDRFTTQFENRTVPFVSAQQVTECWTTGLTSTETDFIIGHGPVAVVPSVAAVWATDYLTGSADATPEEFIQYDEYLPPPP